MGNHAASKSYFFGDLATSNYNNEISNIEEKNISDNIISLEHASFTKESSVGLSRPINDLKFNESNKDSNELTQTTLNLKVMILLTCALVMVIKICGLLKKM